MSEGFAFDFHGDDIQASGDDSIATVPRSDIQRSQADPSASLPLINAEALDLDAMVSKKKFSDAQSPNSPTACRCR